MAKSSYNKRNTEVGARARAAWIVAAIAVLLLAGVVWWMWQNLSRDDRRAGDRDGSGLGSSMPYPKGSRRSPLQDPSLQAELAPAERERALRAEQLQTVEQLVAAFPESDDAVYLLGLVHNEQGNTEGAMKSWRRSLEIDPSRADANDSLGHALLLRDEYEKAEEYFRKALAIDPSLSTANTRLATTLLHQGKLREAASVLEKTRSLDAEGHRLLGEAYQRLEEFEKAKASYTKAMTLKSDMAEACYGLSKVLNRLGEREQADKYFQTFSVLRERAEERGRDVRANYDTMAITGKSVAQTHTDVGRVYMIRGRAREAEMLWLKAHELDPQNTLCRLQLAVLYQQTGRYREALEYYQEIASLDPKDALVQLNLGRVCVKLNEIERAEQAFAQAIQLAPDQPEAHSSLAELYLQTGRSLGRAITLAETAVKLAPEAKYYALLGQAYAMNNDRAGALAAFDRAIELKPDNAQYVQFRTMLLEKQ
jgi:tetratricopeptide (TPR) repeat protein